MATSKNAALAGTAAAILYVFLWSSGFVAIKIGVRYCPPLTFVSIRCLAAAAFMWGLTRWLGMSWPRTRSAWFRLVTSGVLNMLIPASCNFIALRQVSVGMAAIVTAANPLLLTLIAPKLLGESLTGRRILGLVLGFGGVVFVMIARLGGGGETDTPLGVVLLCIQVVSLIGATVFLKRFPPREPLMIVNSVQQLATGSLLIPFALLFEHPSKTVLNLPLGVSFFYVVAISSILGPLLWFWLLAKGEASVATSYLFLSPLFGLMLGSVFLGEKLTIRDGFGLVAVTLGIILIRRPKMATK